MPKTGIHYLDTSALVKLLLYPDIPEDGSEALAKFRERKTSFYTIDLCVGESLNVLKRKYFSKARVVSMDGYLICIKRLLCSQKPGHTLHVKSVELNDSLFLEVKPLVRDYDIDFVDAVLLTIAKSHRPYTYDQNLLITADKSLQNACKALKMNVWNCINEDPPA